MKADIKRVVCVILALCMITVALAGCSSGNVGASNRDGVVRIAVMYILSYYPVVLDEEGNVVYRAEEPSQQIEKVMSLGSGFGIGKAGQETQYFVTNRHVVEDITGYDLDVYDNLCYCTAYASRIYIL